MYEEKQKSEEQKQKRKQEQKEEQKEEQKQEISEIDNHKKTRKRLKGKIIALAIFFIVVIVAVWGISSGKVKKLTKKDVISTSQLEKAIDISQLSTAEFIYNGIAEKYEDDEDEPECRIKYNAKVKVGVDMKEIQFDIDDEDKKIIAKLPEIKVNIADIDENEISYMPQDPDIELKEVISLCKKDAIEEADKSGKLYETAEENLQTSVRALLTPLLNNSGYSLEWAKK